MHVISSITVNISTVRNLLVTRSIDHLNGHLHWKVECSATVMTQTRRVQPISMMTLACLCLPVAAIRVVLRLSVAHRHCTIWPEVCTTQTLNRLTTSLDTVPPTVASKPYLIGPIYKPHRTWWKTTTHCSVCVPVTLTSTLELFSPCAFFVST